jgi:tetratricopeptide (TPR) repeat protein
VRAFCGVAVLTFGVALSARAQLAVTQPTEKLLMLPLPVANVADSAASVAAMDAAREKLASQARYKVTVIPKNKICEALKQSGFPCDGLMTDLQAGQLARALGINSYTTGMIERAGSLYVAKMRVMSGASGFAAAFTLNGATTPQGLGELIAQRLNNIVRAAEYARNCNEQRSRNQLDRALNEAKKAFEIEPNLAAANLCMATVYEVQHAPPDSIIAAARRALKGDPGNSEAWNRIASSDMVKGDTIGALDAYDSLLAYNPNDQNLLKGLVQLSMQHHDYNRAQRLLRRGLAVNPNEQPLKDMLKRACIEGLDYTCTLGLLKEEVDADSTKLSDTTELKLAIANAQAAADTQALLWWSRAAVSHFPTSAVWLKQLGGAFQTAGQIDSAVAYYQKALAANPGDVPTSLLIAKTMVDNAVWDTAKAGGCQRNKDTLCLSQMRAALVPRVDPAREYLSPGFTSPDSAYRLTAAVVALSGGSKLAQAGAYDAAYPWLDQLLTVVAPRSPADTVGPRHAIRLQASFWFGLSSTLSLGAPYGQMVKDKSCDEAKSLNDRIQRTKQALDFGGRVAPGVAAQMRNILLQYANNMPKVKQAFKCRNF